jgi:Holliday junction resolvase RusA-like endonuclease
MMYTIKGEPAHYTNRRLDEQAHWSDAKQQRIKALIELAEQANYSSPITYPILLTVAFYSSRKPSPDLVSLLKFVISVLQEDIIKGTRIIREIKVTYQHDPYPRTVIVLRKKEENGKKNGPKRAIITKR